MICNYCGNESFNVVRVLRNRRLRKGKYKVTDNVDSREVICRICGKRYVTETILTGEIVCHNYKTYTKETDGEYEYNQQIESDQ